MSPELSLHKPLENPRELDAAFSATVEPRVFDAVVNGSHRFPWTFPFNDIKKLVTYLMPAMKKVQRRDGLYVDIREKTFTAEAGRELIKELSIDELPGETTPQTLAVCLALAEAMGMRFDFIAPNIGFQKNIPYADNAALEKKIKTLFSVAASFDVSIGFHSGSGKSADNYRVMGNMTKIRFEVKTSGRYTYEMGVALGKFHGTRRPETLGRLVCLYKGTCAQRRLFRERCAKKLCP
jgi:hypothetical protein